MSQFSRYSKTVFKNFKLFASKTEQMCQETGTKDILSVSGHIFAFDKNIGENGKISLTRYPNNITTQRALKLSQNCSQH